MFYATKMRIFNAAKVAKIAKERGVTRATVSMEKAAQIEKPVIFAIGNAPTALIELYEMIQSGSYRPDDNKR